MTTSNAKVDTKLRWNVTAAFLLMIICPLALWQFHFRNDFSEGPKQLSIPERVIAFYKALDKQGFDANQYFATEVLQYDSSLQVTPAEINTMIQLDRKINQYPRTEVETKTIISKMDDDGNSIATVKLKYTCYRKSIVKYVTFEREQRIVFDKSNKVVSFETLKKSPEVLSFTMPK